MGVTASKQHWTPARIVLWSLVMSIMGLVTLRLLFIRWRDSRPAKINPADIQRALLPPRLDGTHPCVSASVMFGRITTSLGRCSMPTDHPGEVDRFEADLRYGAFVLRQTDLHLSNLPKDDSLAVPLTRSYFSRDWISANPLHSYGRNTSQPYDIAPIGSRWPYTYILLVLEDGDFLYFKRISPGTGFSDAVFLHTETSTRFYKSIIAWNGKGWTLRLADGGEMHFPESYGATNLAQGAAFQFIDSRHKVLTLRRDAQRNLIAVVTPDSQHLRFAEDARSRIVRAEDDNGNWVTYLYNSDDMLTDKLSSSGGARHYDYEKELLTSVHDEQGQTLVRNIYESGTLIGQTYGNGDVYRFQYVRDPVNRSLKSVIVTLPNGNSEVVDPFSGIPKYAFLME